MGAALAAAAAARGAEVTLVAGPGTPNVQPAAPAAARAHRHPRPRRDAAELALAWTRRARRGRRRDGRGGGRLSPARAGGGQAVAARRGRRASRSSSRPSPTCWRGSPQARRGARPYPGRLRGRDGRRRRRSRGARRGKLREKGCDAIVANDVSAPGIGFDADDNEVTVLFADGGRVDIPRASKRAVADQLWTLFASRLRAEAGRRPDGRARGPACLIRASRPTRPRRCATSRRPAACWSRDRRRPAGTGATCPPGRGRDDRRLSRHAVGGLDLGAPPAPVGGRARFEAARGGRLGLSSRPPRRASSPTRSTAPPATRPPTTARMVLLAAAAEQALGRRRPRAGRRSPIARPACSSMHLGVLDDLSGREFRDPGFLALRARSTTRAPSTIGACSPAGASSSSARSA